MKPSIVPPKKTPVETRDSVSGNWHNLDNRLAVIAESVYFKHEKHGDQFGHAIEDWFEAEQKLAENMGER